jgi:hypothetical protein
VTRRNSILLVAVALAAMAGAYWMLILSPKHDEAAALGTQITAKQTALAAAQDELATYEKARDAYKANYSQVARLGKAVPADDDVRSLLVQLNSAAKSTKVDFRKITLGGSGGAAPGSPGGPAAPAAGSATPPPGSATVGSAGFSTMPFSFAFNGSFNGLGDFFNKLDRFVKVNSNGLDVTGRLLLVNSITLQPDTTKGFPLLSAEVSANSYLLPPAQGLLEQATAEGLAAADGSTPPAADGSTPAATPPATTTTATVTGATR